MSQALRKLPAPSTNDTTMIFINHLRKKGRRACSGSCRTRPVTLADGTQGKLAIRQSAAGRGGASRTIPRRIPVSVPKAIVNWFNTAHRAVPFSSPSRKSGGNGRAQFAATETHLVRTPEGWRPTGGGADPLLPASHLRDEAGSVPSSCSHPGLADGKTNAWPRTPAAGPVTGFRMGHGAKQRPTSNSLNKNI